MLTCPHCTSSLIHMVTAWALLTQITKISNASFFFLNHNQTSLLCFGTFWFPTSQLCHFLLSHISPSQHPELNTGPSALPILHILSLALMPHSRLFLSPYWTEVESILMSISQQTYDTSYSSASTELCSKEFFLAAWKCPSTAVPNLLS